MSYVDEKSEQFYRPRGEDAFNKIQHYLSGAEKKVTANLHDVVSCINYKLVIFIVLSMYYQASARTR